MNRLEELQQEEIKLKKMEENLSRERKQVRQIKEQYARHFKEAGTFFYDIRYQFQTGKERQFFDTTSEEFSRRNRQIIQQLEQGESDISIKQKRLQIQLEDISHKRRSIIQEEKDEH